jgi:hypothetical protein
MSGYIDDFKNHRVQLQEALSLYTASNVNVLVTKMNDLVSRLLATKPDWEKTLATQTHDVGDRSKWLESDVSLQAVVSAAEDPILGGIATKKVLGDLSERIQSDASLQAVVEAAEDPVLGGIVTKKVESKSNEMRDVQSTKLSELRDELELSLDELCNRNMKIFELKLAFHIQKLQDGIASSAQLVKRTLSGTHDRLLHEVCPFTDGFVYRSRIVFYQDLRELWKEMVSVGLG